MFYAFTSSRCSNRPPLTSSISDSDHSVVLAANLSNGAGFLFHPAGELEEFFADHWNRRKSGGPMLITEEKDRLQVPCQPIGVLVSRKFLCQQEEGLVRIMS